MTAPPTSDGTPGDEVRPGAGLADAALGAPRIVLGVLRGLVEETLSLDRPTADPESGGPPAAGPDDATVMNLGVIRAGDPDSDPATAPPVANEGQPLAVERSFAFVDICGFTAYCDRHGEQEAVEVLARFRTVTRHVVGRRGVRVGKWLGDGVMLVGTEPGPAVAASVELVGRFGAMGINTHVGVASGHVLVFEGDDYVGRTVNLAARLCEAAGPDEVLVANPLPPLPNWIDERGTLSIEAAGIGRVDGVHLLGPNAAAAALLRSSSGAA